MKNGAKVTIINLQKRIKIDYLKSRKIKKTILKVLSFEGIKKPVEVNVCFVNDKKIRQLHKKYLSEDSPTDVIAFNLSKKPKADTILADIIISTDTAFSNSEIFNDSTSDELFLYLVHGMLHIAGYDDKTKKERLIMEKRANRILESL